LKQLAYHVGQVLGVVRWDLRVDAFKHFLIEALHVVSLKGRAQGDHLVEDTA